MYPSISFRNEAQTLKKKRFRLPKIVKNFDHSVWLVGIKLSRTAICSVTVIFALIYCGFYLSFSLSFRNDSLAPRREGNWWLQADVLRREREWQGREGQEEKSGYY